MINFSELKEKLLKFYEVEAWNAANLVYQPDRPHQEWHQLGAKYQFNKDTKIISALLEIIDMQDKQVCGLHNYIQHNEDNLVGDDLKGDDRFTERFKRYIKSTNDCLSETESKLKQLIKGE